MLQVKQKNNSRFYKLLAMEMLIYGSNLCVFFLQMPMLVIKAKEKSSARRAILRDVG